MTDVAIWPVMVMFVSQILTYTCVGYPLMFVDGPKKGSPETTKSKRSTTPICQPKTRLSQSRGVITSPQYKTLNERGISCSWLVQVPRRQQIKLDFLKFDVEDSCPGICKCNYVTIKEPARKIRSVLRKYCNERTPPQNLISMGRRAKIHLRLKAGGKLQHDGFTIRYTAVSKRATETTPLTEKVNINSSGNIKLPDGEAQFVNTPGLEKTFGSKALTSEYKSSVRNRRVSLTSSDVNATVKTPETSVDDKESGPSKLAVLLAVAIPVVMIFIFVVLLIAYYNHMIEKKQMQARDDMLAGSTISEMILNSSATLTPMFNLKKAKRESSHRKEKANQLYDDMLNSWKETNANRKERLKAKQESVNVWESYQASRKQRKTAKDPQDSKAFAVLVSNAINVATNPSVPDTNEPVEEHVEATPRPSSILINRHLSEDIRQKRNSKVLSWSDVSKKGNEEKKSEKKASSETELTIRRSGHIPAIVVSQPSVETEDDDAEANDTDRLIKDDKIDGAERVTDVAKAQPNGTALPNKTSTPTYSCSEHVKDILRQSYGEELEEWWQKPKKSESKGSLKDSSSSDVKYKAMKSEEDDID